MTWVVWLEEAHCLSHGLSSSLCGINVPGDARRYDDRPTDVDECMTCHAFHRRMTAAYFGRGRGRR